MSNFKILIKLLKKNLIKNLIIMVQVIFSIYVLTILLFQIIDYTEKSSMLAKMDMDNILVFSESLHINNLMEGEGRTRKYEEVKNYLQELEGVKEVFNTYSTMLQNQDFYTMMYDEGILTKLSFTLEEGENFSDEILAGDTIPIIISSKLKGIYKLNNIYKFSIYSILDSNEIEFNVKVIGIMKEGACVYTGESNQTVPQITDLFVKVGNDEELIIMPNRFKNTENYTTNRGFTVLLENKELFMEKSYQNALDTGLGKFTQRSEYGNNFYQSFIANYDYYIYLFIATYLFVLTSVGGYNLLATLNYKRLLTIYFINGITWLRGITLIVIRNLLVIMIPTVIVAIVCGKSLAQSQGTDFNNSILWITIILYLIVFLLTTFGTTKILLKTKPSEVLKEEK